jgi:MFS family permease
MGGVSKRAGAAELAEEAFVGPPAPAAVDDGAGADHRRSSFGGLILARMGSRPYGSVMGNYLTLLVASRASSALAIFLALSGHRVIAAVTYPVAGRLSDRTTARLGRRVPYMVGGLATMGAAVWMMTVVDSYWALLIAVLVARQAAVFNWLARFTSIPDIFGRSRWALAFASVFVTSILPSAAILAVIRFTWDQDDPSTWSLTFRLAAAGLLIAAVAVALFVREAPAARTAARIARDTSWLDEVRDVLALPNAKVLVTAGALLIGAGAATGRLLPVWAHEHMGAGAPQLVDASVATTIGTIAVVPIGLWLGQRAHPRLLTVAACIFGAAVTFGHWFVTELWMFVAAAIVTVPLATAAILSVIPLVLKIIPRADNLGESVGMVFGPVVLGSTLAGLMSAALVDARGDYRIIWLVSGVFLVLTALVLTRLAVPAEHTRVSLRRLLDEVRRLAHPAAAPASGERGIVGRLFGGRVDDRDVLGPNLRQ